MKWPTRAKPRRPHRGGGKKRATKDRWREPRSGGGVGTIASVCCCRGNCLASPRRGEFFFGRSWTRQPRILIRLCRCGAATGDFRGVASAAGLSWLLATAGGLAQGGLVFAPSALAPSLNRINPASRLEQLFSLNAVSRAAEIAVADGDDRLPDLRSGGTGLGEVSCLAAWQRPSGLLAFAGERMFALAWKSSLVLLAWSAADYLLERWRHENELKMSRQDLRDEYKETEGNPAVKMRIRRLQRQARRRRMLKEVERAAVVITNPTEFAIALEFSVEMAAPVVVAKGRNLLAAQIREVALWHGIPLVENPPLAHALYRAVEVGQAIPPKLYVVVAEILAAIWRAQARAAQLAGVRT